MSINTTHRKRLARMVAAQASLPYQQALDRVDLAAQRGVLPRRLDEAGLVAAVRLLTADTRPTLPPTTAAPMFRMGGPYTTLVSNEAGQRVAPTCDVCGRRLGAGEKWWLVRQAGRSWEGEAGVCCGEHDPASLPSSPQDGSPTGMQVWDLVPNLLVQTPDREVLKVSTIYPRRVTAQVVYPVPARTTVREYTPEQVATWREPSKVMVAKYERAWGFAD